MPGLKIFTSNHLEILAEQLAKTVNKPATSPLFPEIIVVQSRGMERWVSMELAKHNGICANCYFPFPNSFLQEISRRLVPDVSEESPFAPDAMTFSIMKLLPTCIDRPGFDNLKTYLKDDLKSLKLFQLSEKISDIFDQYLVFRPEMIFKWEEGREDHWQAQLWRELVQSNGEMHRAKLRKVLFEKIESQTDKINNLPQRVSIFGISHLPPFHLMVYLEMSKIIQVNLFLMNPCKEYWADIVSDREMEGIKRKYIQTDNISDDLHLEKGNRLLSSMGAHGRDFFSFINRFDCEMHEQFEDKTCDDILSCIQSDILNLRDRVQKNAFGRTSIIRHSNDTSIQIHSCHSSMREIEILHDNLLAMFEKDPDLIPKDIVVMTPDIELYAPFIHAVFDTQTDDALHIPFSIADQNVGKENRVINGFLSLLDLKDSRFGVAQVMALLGSPGIKEKFGLSESDIEIAERWISDTNIRWGLDAENRVKFGVPGFSENTWKAGIERLLLGYAMPGRDKNMFSEILPYDNIEGSDVKILGKFLEFLENVFSCIAKLNKPRKINKWGTILNLIHEQIFLPDEDSEREIQIIRRILDDLIRLKELSGFDQEIDFEVIRSYIERQLKQEYFDSGFISGGLTFCTMLPMRSIPFKVICLIGMNNDAFPRDYRSVGFDLVAQHPKPGDRSRRNDDKFLFLETLISAGSKLYISYVGQNIQDNTTIPPSVLVSELLDYIKLGFGLSEEQIVTYHRLQAFSPAYFKGNEKLFSYSEENLLAGASIFGYKDSPTFISTGLSMSSEESKKWKSFDMDHLCDFFRNPTKFILQRRLGIYLEEGGVVSDERENFSLDNLEKYLIGQDLLEKRLTGTDLKDSIAIQKAKGQLPHGNVGDIIFDELRIEAETFVDKIKNYTKGKHLDTLEIDVEIEGFNLFGRLAEIYEKGLFQICYANTKAKYLLKTWIYHLILCSFSSKKYPMNSILICKDSAWEFGPVNNSRSILRHLLNYYWKGLIKSLHFFPESSFKYAQGIMIKKKSRRRVLRDARNKWIGSDFVSGESQDPYYKLCFGKTDPIDEEFREMAEKIFSPLLEFCKEIVLMNRKS